MKFATISIAGLAMLAVAPTAQAQILFATASTDGSYCKFKKHDTIEVDTWLPLGSDPEFGRAMTLRRAAEMTRSRGLSSFVALSEGCGTLRINQRATNLRCGIKAKMEHDATMTGPLARGETRYSVPEIIAKTEADAPAYPRRSGLLNYKNQCVVD